MESENRRSNWVIDKHVPLALILAILVQTMGAFWWASRVQATIENNAVRIAKLESLALDINRLSERQVRLEVQNENVEKILNRIEEKIRKIK
jgi:hypothetical protein